MRSAVFGASGNVRVLIFTRFLFTCFLFSGFFLTDVLPIAFAQDESIDIRTFSNVKTSGTDRSAVTGAALDESALDDATLNGGGLNAPESRREYAVRLNEQGVALVLQGRKEEGFARIKQALAQDPKNVTILYNLAGLYMTSEKPDKAILIMDRVVDIDPRDTSFLNRHAEASIMLEKGDDAVRMYERIRAINPRHGDVLVKLGMLYAMREEWEKAEETFYQARDIFGDTNRILSNLGSVLVAREKYPEAVDVLTTALEKNPTIENATALGVAYESAGNMSRAIVAYEKAQSLGEESDELSAHITRLKTVSAE